MTVFPFGPAMSSLARTPEPPYVMVVFTSQMDLEETDDYGATSDRMRELVVGMDGFLGMESVRGADGFGITVSYWRDEASVAAWKRQVEHLKAQAQGRARWYTRYALRAGTVERETGKGWKEADAASG